MNLPKHPNDRFNGFVLLRDGSGDFFVPSFPRAGQTDLAYCRAFLQLGRQLDAANKKEQPNDQ